MVNLLLSYFFSSWPYLTGCYSDCVDPHLRDQKRMVLVVILSVCSV